MLCLFDGSFLFIIDLFSNNIIKKFEMKIKDGCQIKSLCLLKRKGQEYLYISTKSFKISEKNNNIIKGIII